MAKLNEEVDAKKVIADLGKTDWGVDNDAQMKAVQLLKGLALSDDPASNKFMKGLSDASTKLAQTIVAESKLEEADTTVKRASLILDEMDDMEPPKPHQSATVSRANELL